VEIENTFTVPVGIDDAWKVLLDVERIAPCMPGASLLSVDGDQFTGAVKVKVGPITVNYKGQASFVAKDESAYRAVIQASGKETKGSGTAQATVTTQLAPQGAETLVTITTDLAITGRPAQFGRGVMADVSNGLVKQFATALAATVASAGDTATADDEEPTRPEPADATPRAEKSAPRSEPTAARVQPAAAVELDLGRALAWPVAKRLLPVVGAVVLLVLLLRRRGR
jgi:carbon monoxide dehydrogenase subunit G